MTAANGSEFVRVPVEPTEAMLAAASAVDNEMFAHGSMHGAHANQIYRAMIAAAPPAESQPQVVESATAANQPGDEAASAAPNC